MSTFGVIYWPGAKVTLICKEPPLDWVKKRFAVGFPSRC